MAAVRLLFFILALLLAGTFAGGCGKSPQKVLAAATAFEDAHGRKWSGLLLTPTDSPDRVGFRARYELLEPEFERVTIQDVWRETAVATWIPFEAFILVQHDATFVRQVRSKGSTGWATGMFSKSWIDQALPAKIFTRTGYVVPRPTEPLLIDRFFDDALKIGAVIEDYPDGGVRRGLDLPSMQLPVGQPVLDLRAPDFEAKIRELAARKLAEIEEQKLPGALRQLPVAERPAARARMDATLAAAKSALEGERNWEGTLRFPKVTIPVRILSHYRVAPDSPLDATLSFTIKRADGKPGQWNIDGRLMTEPGPDVFAYFRMNSRNMTPEYRARIERELATATNPLDSGFALLNCQLKIRNARQLELVAEGLPVVALTRRN